MKREIDFRPATHELAEIMFPVLQLPVFVKTKINDSLFPNAIEYESKDHKALFNERDENILSIVSNNYKLITNEQALEIGKKAFVSLFPSVNKDDLIPFKVIATKKLTSCHIDLIHKEVKLDKWNQDTWLPFLRVSNSYNRSVALSFELGFVRELCANGFIFDKKTVKVKYAHTKGAIPAAFEVDVSKLKKFEVEFVNYLNNLNRFYVDPKYVFPLVLKALNLKFKVIKKPSSKREEIEYIKFHKTKEVIASLTDHYYEELNPTAYAVLNVITDIISHQKEYKIIPFFHANVNSYYQKPTHWMRSFVKAIQDKRFTMEDYLGDFQIYLN